MEIRFDISFNVPDEDLEFWKKLGVGLCEDKRGAWLECQFDDFGDAAAQQIEVIMDECDKHGGLNFEEWEQEENGQLHVYGEGGWSTIELLPMIGKLLEICGATNIQFPKVEDEEM